MTPNKVKFTDLSLEIKEGLGEIPADSPVAQLLGAKIHYTSHQESVPQMLRSFPGSLRMISDRPWLDRRTGYIEHPHWHSHGRALALSPEQ